MPDDSNSKGSSPSKPPHALFKMAGPVPAYANWWLPDPPPDTSYVEHLFVSPFAHFIPPLQLKPPMLGEAVLPPVKTVRLDKLKSSTVKLDATLDVRLQLAAVRERMGVGHAPTASTGPTQISVIGRAKSVQAWQQIPEVRSAAWIATLPDGSVVVTGRVRAAQLPAVRRRPGVISLDAARNVRSALNKTTSETGIRPDQPLMAPARGGAGVVIGIIDNDADVAHRNFRTADGKTRFAAIWNQNDPTNEGPVRYGRFYSREQIDAALGTTDAYAALGYAPAEDTMYNQGTHGTHVADIAAGNGSGSGVAGCAPEAEIVFVDVSATDIAWSGPASVGQSFGDSVQLLEAVKFVFAFAGDKPCVVNLSLDTNGGPHDGTTLFEQAIDALVTEKPNRCVVISAGNAQEDDIHAQGTIPPDGSLDLPWQVLLAPNGNELEVWLPATDRIALELLGPDGISIGVAEPGVTVSLMQDEQLPIILYSQLRHPTNGDNTVGVYLAGGVPPGIWTVRLHSRSATPVSFHAWIERNDYGQASFVTGTPTHVVGSIACGRETIVVGSYDAHVPGCELSSFSAAGPTRDGRPKPEVSAPGEAVVAAYSRTGDQTTVKSGTSMAAPAVAGVVALLFEEAQRLGVSLSSQQLRELLTESARSTPPDVSSSNRWHQRYGFGRISSAVLELLRQKVAAGDIPKAAPGGG